MYRSGPGLHGMHILYWCILNRIHCERVATSFLNIATRGLWSVIMLTSHARWNFSSPWSIPSISLSVLLYHLSAPERLLQMNAVGLSIMLSGICHEPIPNASVSKCMAFPVSKNSIQVSFSFIQHFILVLMLPVETGTKIWLNIIYIIILWHNYTLDWLIIIKIVPY